MYEIFNKYFENVVKSLKIPEFKNIDCFLEQISQPLLKAIVKYCKHSSIASINESFSISLLLALQERKISLIRFTYQIKKLNQKRLPKILAYLSKF